MCVLSLPAVERTTSGGEQASWTWIIGYVFVAFLWLSALLNFLLEMCFGESYENDFKKYLENRKRNKYTYEKNEKTIEITFFSSVTASKPNAYLDTALTMVGWLAIRPPYADPAATLYQTTDSNPTSIQSSDVDFDTELDPDQALVLVPGPSAWDLDHDRDRSVSVLSNTGISTDGSDPNPSWGLLSSDIATDQAPDQELDQTAEQEFESSFRYKSDFTWDSTPYLIEN